MESIRKISLKLLKEKIEEMIEKGITHVDVTSLPLKNKLKFTPLYLEDEEKETIAA